MGLANLPKSKWSGAGRQVILKNDFIDIEDGIFESSTMLSPPNLKWVDATAVKVPATADDIAPVLMLGFPSILHPGMFINASLTDKKYRANTADASLDFDVAASLWGTEKVSQWYMVYALADDADTTFTIKAMPFMRVKSQATQTISLGTLTTPATGIGYGFTTDELVDAKIYLLSGDSLGLVRTISANNNDNTTGGTLTYTGTALSVDAGDWLVVLPNTNFRWLGDIFNTSSGHIREFDLVRRDTVYWLEDVNLSVGPSAHEDIQIASPLATIIGVSGASGGAGYDYIGHPDGGHEVTLGAKSYTSTYVEGPPISVTNDIVANNYSFGESAIRYCTAYNRNEQQVHYYKLPF